MALGFGPARIGRFSSFGRRNPRPVAQYDGSQDDGSVATIPAMPATAPARGRVAAHPSAPVAPLPMPGSPAHRAMMFQSSIDNERRATAAKAAMFAANAPLPMDPSGHYNGSFGNAGQAMAARAGFVEQQDKIAAPPPVPLTDQLTQAEIAAKNSYAHEHDATAGMTQAKTKAYPGAVQAWQDDQEKKTVQAGAKIENDAGTAQEKIAAQRAGDQLKAGVGMAGVIQRGNAASSADETKKQVATIGAAGKQTQAQQGAKTAAQKAADSQFHTQLGLIYKKAQTELDPDKKAQYFQDAEKLINERSKPVPGAVGETGAPGAIGAPGLPTHIDPETGDLHKNGYF